MKRLLTCLFAAGFLLAAGAGEASPRQSITFILGTDEDPALAMYRMAETYFREDPQERTDAVVTEARSLEEVRDFLLNHPTKNKDPWGIINLVVHGSSTGSLDVGISAGETTCLPSSLEERLRKGGFHALPDTVLDEASEIRLHGCSVGKAPRLLKLLSRLLGGEDSRRPVVRASRYYTCFHRSFAGGGRVLKHLCEAWNLGFRPGERPSPEVLARQFRKLHPRSEVDIEQALRQSVPQVPGDVFSYETPQAYRWTHLFQEAGRVPVFTNQASLHMWLLSRPPFLHGLQTAGLSFLQFHWVALRTSRTWGSIDYPALEVMGSGRTIHVLRVLEEPARLGAEAWKDPRFYASAR